MELENLVRFSSHRRPFLVSDDYCDNPDCECTDVFLKFTELGEDGKPLAAPLSFRMRVDLETWEEQEPPARPPRIAEFAKEFLESFPEERRSELRAHYERHKRVTRRLAEYRIKPEEVEEGTLISYSDVVSETGGISGGGSSCSYRFTHHEREYLVEDLYCSNPDCRCREVHLLFLEYVPDRDGTAGGDTIRDRFMAKVSLDGRREVEKGRACSLDEATEILAAWWERFDGDLAVLKSRYKTIKEIGRRSLPRRKAKAVGGEEPVRPVLPVGYRADPSHPKRSTGRNDPCPCGSGKKYKKCCGRDKYIDR
ncbi:MAG TPA: SEC-C metal-binding domain-containing protein [Thermoguttaceae bacterium]|nr:SEC-C metal-binding domain-containing protein [Thermoguttaceae bacterium]